MRGNRFIFILLALLAAALVLYGCGEGGGTAVTASNISMGGGSSSTTMSGGGGGDFYVQGTTIHGVTISSTGAANASFTVPSFTEVDLGTNPYTFTADTTVAAVMEAAFGGDDPAAGTVYLVNGSSYPQYMYISDDDGATADETPITGIQVNAGITVTLGLNYNSGGNNGQDMARVYFNEDVNILGTLTTQDLTNNLGGTTTDMRHASTATTRDMGSLDLWAEQLFVGANGSVDTSGGTLAASRGGDGGGIWLGADNLVLNEGAVDCSGGAGMDFYGGDACVSSGWNPWASLYSDGAVAMNTGTINANGGDGGTGGDGGYGGGAEVYGFVSGINTGTINANGGDGDLNDTNSGGYAYSGGGNGLPDCTVWIEGVIGSAANSGNVSARGGSGGDYGADGGCVAIVTDGFYADFFGPFIVGDSYQRGDVYNSGDIDVSGGNGTVDASGGSGGGILIAAPGAVRTSGDLTANGGFSNSTSQWGGEGGYIYVLNDRGEDLSPFDYSFPQFGIEASGQISATGGAGNDGGYGGYGGELLVAQTDVYLFAVDEPSDSAAQKGIEFYGMSNIDVSGGDGTDYGGSGAPSTVQIMTLPNWIAYSDTFVESLLVGAPGPIVNQANIDASGGDATDTDGEGGSGGVIVFRNGVTGLSDGQNSDGQTAIVNNSGNLDVSGGSGDSSGGYGGGIVLLGIEGVTNSGQLNLEGGDSTSGTGGQGANIYVYTAGLQMSAYLDVTNSGQVLASGGSGDIGGDGADEWIVMTSGRHVTNSGNIDADGGDGVSSNGSGGGISISSFGNPTNNTGTLSADAGAGAGSAGFPGEIWVDWVCLSVDNCSTGP